MTLPNRRSFCAGVALSLLIHPQVLAQQAADAVFAIEKVEVTGLKRYSSGQVIKLSGLSIGSPVRVSDLVAAAKRMADTGLFANVSYRYSTGGDNITVTLEIEEAGWTMPVVFDNFVWLSDKELATDVSQEMPTFDGTVPATDNARQQLARTLQKALQSRKLPGTVEILAYMNMRTRSQQYVARVSNPTPVICSVRLSGASEAMEREVKSVTDPLSGTEFSRAFLVGISEGTLLDIYRRRGYWAAAIGVPAVAVDPACGGVALTMSFDEGAVYHWDGADWRGNESLAADRLSPLFSIRPGDVADSRKLDEAVRKVRDLYATVGHVTAAVTYSPQLSTQGQRVRFTVEVKEGPQFRMGTMTVNGLPAGDAANLQKKWKLKSGEIFNKTLADEFVRKDLMPLLKQRGLRPDAFELRQGAAPQTIDVTINARK